jgi:hypothetical protein
MLSISPPLSLKSGAASFLGFTWPKTTLTPKTERGLTSEFGMGSGGARALWPATPQKTLVAC